LYGPVFFLILLGFFFRSTEMTPPPLTRSPYKHLKPETFLAFSLSFPRIENRFFSLGVLSFFPSIFNFPRFCFLVHVDCAGCPPSQFCYFSSAKIQPLRNSSLSRKAIRLCFFRLQVLFLQVPTTLLVFSPLPRSLTDIGSTFLFCPPFPANDPS